MFDQLPSSSRQSTTESLAMRRSYAVSPTWLAIALLVPTVAIGLVACETTETTDDGPAAGPKPVAPTKAGQARLAITGDPDKDADAFATRLQQAEANPPAANVEWDSPQGAITESRSPTAALRPIDPQPRPRAPRLDQPVEPKSVAVPEPVVVHKPAPPMTRRQLLDKLAEHLRIEAGKGELRPQLAIAAMTLADPRRELTGDDLATLDKEDRRIILAYQRAFTQLARTLGESSTADRTQLQLTAEELAEDVGVQKQLRLRNTKLARKVTGYGQYVPFKSTTFIAGSEHPVIVYAEVENFQPAPQADGSYAVKLNQEIVLYNESDGLAVWKVRPQQIVDRSANRRRDFFVVQVVRLPNRLTVGKYLMKLTVTDEVGQQIDEATVPIQIVAENQLATP